MTGDVVLIENQLEASDHTHLGQILTYLAGLGAKAVIWVAREFAEPHLSAIRWLNAHTGEEFSFFAVRARVVRIGDSPLAPVFEVVERPSSWERNLTARIQSSARSSGTGDLRFAYWTHYLQRHPAAADEGAAPSRSGNLFIRIDDNPVVLSLWVGQRQCGIYLRGLKGTKRSAAEALHPFAADIETAIGRKFAEDDPDGHVICERLDASFNDRSNWDQMCDWMEARRNVYFAAVRAALARQAASAG
ncbi:hypothetical protein ACFFJB_04565 [Camelimonas abortus]